MIGVFMAFIRVVYERMIYMSLPSHFKTLFLFCAGDLCPLVPDKGAAHDLQWGPRLTP